MVTGNTQLCFIEMWGYGIPLDSQISSSNISQIQKHYPETVAVGPGRGNVYAI